MPPQRGKSPGRKLSVEWLQFPSWLSDTASLNAVTQVVTYRRGCTEGRASSADSFVVSLVVFFLSRPCSALLFITMVHRKA